MNLQQLDFSPLYSLRRPILITYFSSFDSSETLTKKGSKSCVVNWSHTIKKVTAMNLVANKLSLQEFLAMPESGDRYELVDGSLVPKMTPTTPHSRVQKRLLRRIDDWCTQTGNGEVNPEWAVALKRRGTDWSPVPDLTYISCERVPQNWDGEGVCPGIPLLVVEIISPGQTFGQMTQKATDYLLAGVDRVWVVDTQAQSITVFQRDNLPQTFWCDGTIEDPLLPGLTLRVSLVFGRAV